MLNDIKYKHWAADNLDRSVHFHLFKIGIIFKICINYKKKFSVQIE